MPILTSPPTLGDLLKYELNGNYCRETVTLRAGASYPLGAVLGEVTATGKYILSPAAAVAGDEGAEVARAVLLEAVDATGGDATGLILARGPAIVSKSALGFDASIGQPAEIAAKHAELAARGIVARDTA